jgi:hypothetical protein
MGNYNGTIRCGYCYESGHNSRTCPTKLERAQRRYDNAKESGDHVDYYASQVARMTGENPETGAKRSRRNESWGRKCSYCKESGHNRRKCEQLSTDITRYAALTSTVRAEQRALMIEQGIGIGAMVQTNSYGESQMYLVENIKVGKVHPKSPRVTAILRPINPALRVTTTHILPENKQSSYSGYKVLSPVSAEQINQCLPGDWEEQPLDVKDAELTQNPFGKGESRDYYFWREQDDIERKKGE